MKTTTIVMRSMVVILLSTFIFSCSDGEDGTIGPAGPKGEQGSDGQNGADGQNGVDGATVFKPYIKSRRRCRKASYQF